MSIFKFIQSPAVALVAGMSSSAVSMSVTPYPVDLDGVKLTMADFGTTAYLTVDPKISGFEEIISFTGITDNGDNTATLTGLTRNLYSKAPYTASGSAGKAHGSSAVVVFSDNPQLFSQIVDYIDAAVVDGGVPATTTVLGLAKLSCAPVSAPSPIVVGDNDPRFITAAATALAVLPYIFPVGSLYTATVATNPSSLLGFGTWSAFGAGRVLIGAGTGTKVATFASRSSNVITVTGLTNATNNEFQTGQAVLYSAPSGAMTGLTHNTTYYLIRTGNLTFSLATSLANAQNGTVISLSSDGSGVQTFTLTLTVRTGGDTGGEENHAMSATELLAHTHTYAPSGSNPSGTYASGVGNVPNSSNTSSTGGNAAMNVMNPFICVYMWLRTA